MKKHLAIILSVLALFISLTSFGLLYLLDKKTNQDINDIRLEVLDQKIAALKTERDLRVDILEVLKAQQAEREAFCAYGIKAACEKQ
ncbi:hypothetical protein HZB78_05590 [Candidatus Collierbacteria bacterium]|nr:hypothetical protein [Candidatus Collierbacteria bacterium]